MLFLLEKVLVYHFMFNAYWLLLLLVLSAGHLFGQEQCVQYRQCVFPQDRQVKHGLLPSFSRSDQSDDNDQILTIPVVVHVVYRQDMPEITDAQIYSQMVVLNQDFRKLNPDFFQILPQFEALAADSKIEFVLSSADEYGNPTKGITRTLTQHGPFGNSNIYFSALGGRDAWDTQKYLNIWVCDLAPGILGFASAPGSAPSKDGVVVHYENFGTTGTAKVPYQKGRTLTHEIGHWLNLQHLWGVSGGCSEDDGIEDTPMQEGPFFGCQLSRTSCGNLIMAQNFMNVSDDECMVFFTQGQKSVMRHALLHYRKAVIENEQIPLGLQRNEVGTGFNVEVWPNPIVNGEVNLQLSPSLSTIDLWLYDQQGKVVWQKEIINPPQVLSIDMSGYKTGTYVIGIGNRQGFFRQKIILY
jgi:hypothetical protein